LASWGWDRLGLSCDYKKQQQKKKKQENRTKAGRIALSLFLLYLVSSLLLATSDSNAAIPVAQVTPETSDYLSLPFRLLFPSLPANIELLDVTDPAFPNVFQGSDYLSLGTLSDPDTNNGIQPITKTISFNFKGGVRGRVFSSPAWLSVVPNYFANRNGKGTLDSVVSVREDAAKGAGLLPAQRNWGEMQVELNGFVFDYASSVLVGSPKNFKASQNDKVFELYHQVVNLLDRQGALVAAVGTVDYPNGSQFALGLIVDYLGEGEYSRRLAESDFTLRVAETLAGKDYNNDGWIGFTQADLLLGAPGWVLGHSKNGGSSP
jgi:hypothetical protein